MTIFANWIGRHVVARTSAYGVHIGTLIEAEGQSVVLSNARRL
jgi:hypothetical protein